MSASRTRPVTLGSKLSRKHVSLPRSEAVGLEAAVAGSWRGRVHASCVGKLELRAAASLARTRPSTFHLFRTLGWHSAPALLTCGIEIVYLNISLVVQFKHVSKDAKTRRANDGAPKPEP
jgi:hypothetical protein